MTTSRPLVGRSAEMELLRRTLGRSTAGMTVVAIAGEAGIGKTRLVEEAARVAERKSRRARTGQAAELVRDTPFAALVDAFGTFDDSERSRVSALRADQRDHLAAVFPALADLGEPRTEGVHRYHTHHAIARMLEVLGRRTPQALFIDDLHWADQASLELVVHLLRRPPDAPLVLVLAYRPAELARPMQSALDAVERDGRLTRIELGPLSGEEAGELLGGIAWDLHASMYHDSGGNPLFLLQLLAAAARGDRAAGIEEHPRMPGVPAGVRRTLAAELELLPADARRAAHAGAVLGETFATDPVVPVAGLAPDAAAAALDRLVEADLVRPTEPSAMRFRHPIVRRAIYDDAPPAWRTGAHARASAALADRGAPVLQRALHVERSAVPGDAAAVEVLVEAGRVAARYAPAMAARWFEAARRLLPPGPPQADQLPLLVLLGVCLGMAGDLARSREVLGEALALGPMPDRGAIVAFAAGIDHMLGRHEDARALLDEALASAPRGSVEEAAALAELSWDHWFRSDWASLESDGLRGRVAARAAGEPTLEANCAAFLGLGRAAQGRIEEALVSVAEARAMVDELPDAALTRRVTTLFALGVAEGQLERYDDAYRHLSRGAELARQSGQESLFVLLETGVALACTFQGNLVEGARHVAVAVDIAELYDLEHLRGWAEMVHVLHALRSGDVEAAVGAATRGEAAFARMGIPPPSAMCLWCAEAWVEHGDAEMVADRMLPLFGGEPMLGLQPAYRTYASEVLVRAHLALGDPDEAARWADRAEAVATSQALQGTAIGLRARAAVALADGRAGEAAALALESAEAALVPGARIEALMSRLLAGRALVAAGDRARAVTELQRTHREAADCGAARLRDAAAAQLRDIGEHVGRPGRRGRSGIGLAALSDREREVAELVTERLTNREIAERLVLSPKTVERHLARIYRELGISSRVELARAVERARSVL